MPQLDIILEEPAWPDLADLPDEKVIDYQAPIGITALVGGMESGKTSVAMRFDLPDGRVMIAQTSLALLKAAVRTFEAREAPTAMNIEAGRHRRDLDA